MEITAIKSMQGYASGDLLWLKMLCCQLNVSAFGTFPHGAWSDLCSFCHYSISHILFHLFSIVFIVTVLNVKEKNLLLFAYLYIFPCEAVGASYYESWCLTVIVFQITTAGTTATRRAVVTPAPALSSSVTAAAASQITGPVTEIMTAGTTVTRHTLTAPTRVSVTTCWLGGTARKLFTVVFKKYKIKIYLIFVQIRPPCSNLISKLKCFDIKLTHTHFCELSTKSRNTYMHFCSHVF